MRVSTLAAAVLIGSVALSGCSRIKQNQGYIIDEALLSSVQPGVDNRDSVAKTLGRPTFTSEFSPNEWYYVSRNTEQLAFIQPKAKTQSIVKVTFDTKGNVAKVERRGLEQVANVRMNGDKTPTLGRDIGLLEDLFGGVGQFGGAGNAPDSAGGTRTGRDGPK